jgi:tRNA modification GTPase
MRLGRFVSAQGESLDEITAVYMPEGKSYTGLEQVEVFCHGGRHIVGLILQELIKAGARPAEAGEFTKLAFLNGRIDLAKAEAVAELIAANTETSFRAAREHLLGVYSEHIDQIREELIELLAEIEVEIDFVEEEIDSSEIERKVTAVDQIIAKVDKLLKSYESGRIVKEGFRIVIGGRPNVGKSSLFNLVLQQERALVNRVAGTTRDYLSEWIDLEGFAVNLIDTAGLRKGGGSIERQGQAKAHEVIKEANLLLWLVDLSIDNWQSMLKQDLKQLANYPTLVIGNKIDLLESSTDKQAPEKQVQPVSLQISCRTGQGLSELKGLLAGQIGQTIPDLTSGHVVTSARHKQKLTHAISNLKLARRKMKTDESPELTAFDLRQAVIALEEITGRIYTEDILGEVFSRFCVGK